MTVDNRTGSAEPARDEPMRSSADDESESASKVKHDDDEQEGKEALNRLTGAADEVKQDADDRKPFAAAIDSCEPADELPPAEVARKEIARIDALLKKLDRTIKELERDSPEPPSSASRSAFSKRPSPSSSADDEYYEATGSGGPGNRTGKRQRRVTTEEDKQLKQAASRFMHTERGYLHPDTANRMFVKKKRSPNPSDPEEDGEELFDLFIETIGGLDQLTTEVGKKFPRMMSIARAETTNRLRTFAPGILGVSQGTLNDSAHATTVQFRTHDSLGWTYLDPKTKEGYLRSPRLIEAVSLVLYGPTSIGKKGALKRSTSHEHHKGAHWQLKAIPAPLVALAVTIMRSVVMGEKSFRLTGAPAEAVQARAVYDKVRKYVATTPEGAEIRAWLTRELIPERPKEEEEEQEGVQEAGEESGAADGGAAGGGQAEVDQDGDEVMEDAKKPISSSSRRTSSRASSSSSPRKKGGGSAAAGGASSSASASGLSNSFTAAVSKAEPDEGEDELDEE